MSKQEVQHEQAIDPNWLESLKQLHPRDTAEQLRYSEIDTIRAILRQLPDEMTAAVLRELPDELQVELFQSMRLHRVSDILGEMFTDDAVDILGQVDEQRLSEIVSQMDPEQALDIKTLLSYPDDTAGGLMRSEYVAVAESMSLREATDELRREEEDAEGLSYIYVLDSGGKLRGVVPVRELLFKPGHLLVRDIMKTDVTAVSVHADQEEIAQDFRNYRYSALPVIDDQQKLCGVVTVDDVIGVIEEEATEDMQLMVGLLRDEGVETPRLISVRRRLPWLYLNLITAFIAASVIALFEEMIGRQPMLAVFLPVIAMLGGNAGAQTLTIVVRSLALGELQATRHGKILAKEISVALVNGLAIGAAVGLIAWLWKSSPVLGGVVMLATLCNVTLAVAAGVIIPLTLKRLKIDPALASNILLTTAADVVGFFIFLGLASLVFHLLPV